MSTTLVLAVDDDPGILKLTEMSLRGAGFDVLTFDNPRDAIAELTEGLRPDVIVSDVSMPGLDGFAFYEQVRRIQELRAVPFIFLTALGERQQIRYGMSVGADDYITKPFERDELVQAVTVRLRRVMELRRPLEGTVRATAFGQPWVERDGQRLDWDSLKALELLFYLLEHRSGVGTFEVAEALWPGKSESKASSSFHTTLYRLRKVMGGEVVEAANRRYYLHSKFEIDYDVERYRQLCARARESGRFEDVLRAAEVYRGDFLEGFDSEWIEERRLNLRADQLSLLAGAAERAEREGALEQATRLYERLIQHERYEPEAWEGLARVWEARGNRAKAAEVRAQLAALEAELDEA